LRWPRVADAAAIERYCSRWEVAQHTARIPHPYPAGSAERFIFAAREGNASGRDMTLVLTPLRDMREVLGAVSLEGRAQGRLTLGYALAPEAWGKGLASEAVEAIIDSGFSLTDAVEVIASSHVDNPASRRVLEKAGFAFVGSGLEGAPARGGLVPCDRFALSRAAWSARRGGLVAHTTVTDLHEVP